MNTDMNLNPSNSPPRIAYRIVFLILVTTACSKVSSVENARLSPEFGVAEEEILYGNSIGKRIGVERPATARRFNLYGGGYSGSNYPSAIRPDEKFIATRSGFTIKVFEKTPNSRESLTQKFVIQADPVPGEREYLKFGDSYLFLLQEVFGENDKFKMRLSTYNFTDGDVNFGKRVSTAVLDKDFTRVVGVASVGDLFAVLDEQQQPGSKPRSVSLSLYGPFGIFQKKVELNLQGFLRDDVIYGMSFVSKTASVPGSEYWIHGSDENSASWVSRFNLDGTYISRSVIKGVEFYELFTTRNKTGLGKTYAYYSYPKERLKACAAELKVGFLGVMKLDNEKSVIYSPDLIFVGNDSWMIPSPAETPPASIAAVIPIPGTTQSPEAFVIKRSGTEMNSAGYPFGNRIGIMVGSTYTPLPIKLAESSNDATDNYLGNDIDISAGHYVSIPDLTTKKLTTKIVLLDGEEAMPRGAYVLTLSIKNGVKSGLLSRKYKFEPDSFDLSDVNGLLPGTENRSDFFVYYARESIRMIIFHTDSKKLQSFSFSEETNEIANNNWDGSDEPIELTKCFKILTPPPFVSITCDNGLLELNLDPGTHQKFDYPKSVLDFSGNFSATNDDTILFTGSSEDGSIIQIAKKFGQPFGAAEFYVRPENSFELFGASALFIRSGDNFYSSERNYATNMGRSLIDQYVSFTLNDLKSSFVKMDSLPSELLVRKALKKLQIMPTGASCPSDAPSKVGAVASCAQGASSCSGNQSICAQLISVNFGVQSISLIQDAYITQFGRHLANPSCNTGYTVSGTVTDCEGGTCNGKQALCVKTKNFSNTINISDSVAGVSFLGYGNEPNPASRTVVPSCVGRGINKGKVVDGGGGRMLGTQSFCVKKSF